MLGRSLDVPGLSLVRLGLNSDALDPPENLQKPRKTNGKSMFLGGWKGHGTLNKLENLLLGCLFGVLKA